MIVELESEDARAQLAQVRADIAASRARGRARPRRPRRRHHALQPREGAARARRRHAGGATTTPSRTSTPRRRCCCRPQADVGAVEARAAGGRGGAREHQGARAVLRHGAAQARRGRRGHPAVHADRRRDAGVARRSRGAGRRRRGADPQGQGRGRRPRSSSTPSPIRRFRGQVSEIRQIVDRSKAAVTVKVRFVDPIDGRLARHGGEGELSDQGARRRGAQGRAQADRAGRRGRRARTGARSCSPSTTGTRTRCRSTVRGAYRRRRRRARRGADDGDAGDSPSRRHHPRRRVGQGEEEVSDERRRRRAERPRQRRPKKAIIKLRGVRKVYERDTQEIPVLEGIDLDVPEGSFEALMGPSGSGKTTLLNLIAGIDNATAGSVEVNGTDLTRLGEGDLATLALAQYRLHFPVLQSVARVHRVSERRAAAAARPTCRRPSARSASRRRCAWSGSRIAWTTIRASSRAARSSASAIARAIVTDPTHPRRRRADGRSRSQERRGDLEAARSAAPQVQQDHRHGHA